MKKPKLYIETYGCQMNVADSEVVAAILQQHNYEIAEQPDHADLILINTCSIRDNAEQRVRKRLNNLKPFKTQNKNLTIGIIGCMAERIKEKLLEEEEILDIVAGPDSYRELPGLIKTAGTGQKGVNTLLSMEETYAEIKPVRLDENKISAFISIMRGCNNLCAYCVVPYTRGRERSRDPQTILREAKEVFNDGYREITLLGQNVNSYLWTDEQNDIFYSFAELLEGVAGIHPSLRIRFSTSHPKDLSDKVIKTMAEYPNICRNIHLPVQSGSTNVLQRMKRRYSREEYLDRIRSIKKFLPHASVSTDIITGFCGETEDEHKETLSLLNEVEYDFAYMFKYSERPGTLAARKYSDDVPEEIKTRRLNEIIKLQNELSLKSKKKDVGNVFEVLVEGFSKKSDADLFGRTSQNKVVVFPKSDLKPGEYVKIKITDCTSATLIGLPVK